MALLDHTICISLCYSTNEEIKTLKVVYNLEHKEPTAKSK